MTRKSEGDLRFDDPAREREWRVQEDAMQRERLHRDPADDDARSRRYRLLARALRVAPPVGLPKDFAQRMGTLVQASANANAPAMTLEKGLTGTLAGALLLAAIVTIATCGASWLPSFEALLSAPVHEQWLLALIGCLGLSWLVSAGARLMTDLPRP